MRAHLVENGVVVNTVVVNSLLDIPGLVAEDAGFGIGDLWDGASFSHPSPNLAALKSAKNEQINAARLAATYSTFTHGGKVISCDQLSRSDIDGVNGYVALNGALPPSWPGAWKAVDNTLLTISDVAGWGAFYGSMVAAGSANFAHSQTLKAALAAAATAAEIAAIVW